MFVRRLAHTIRPLKQLCTDCFNDGPTANNGDAWEDRPSLRKPRVWIHRHFLSILEHLAIASIYIRLRRRAFGKQDIELLKLHMEILERLHFELLHN